MSASTLSVRSQVSEAEWEQRVHLAACYRMMAYYGWDDLIFSHISARVPNEEGYILMNPYGMFFEEITASSLIKVDFEGRKVLETPYDVVPAGLVIHSAIHAARKDAECVLHLHSLSGVAVSAQKEGVLPISQHSILVLASLAYHDFEGVALRDDEKPRLVADLGDKNFYMLRNHGLITVGDSIPEAFMRMYFFETACKIQIMAQSGGSDLIPIDPTIIATAKEQVQQATRQSGGALACPGVLRKLDRLDPSFRE